MQYTVQSGGWDGEVGREKREKTRWSLRHLSLNAVSSVCLAPQHRNSYITAGPRANIGSSKIHRNHHHLRRNYIATITAKSDFSFIIMAPPSKLAVATSVVRRLVKEEASYHKELEQQEARIAKLQSNMEDENAEYTLKQEVCSLC